MMIGRQIKRLTEHASELVSVRRAARRPKPLLDSRIQSRVVFVCQTENNLHTKEVWIFEDVDSPQWADRIRSSRDYLEYWVGSIIRDGETLVRWWVEDDSGSTIEDFGTDLSVYVNEHGKLKKRR